MNRITAVFSLFVFDSFFGSQADVICVDAYKDLTLARVCRMPNPMFFRNVLLTSVCLHRISHESYCCIRVGFKEWQSVLLKNAELIQDELIQVAGS